MSVRDDFPMLASLAKSPSAGPLHREADRVLAALEQARSFAGFVDDPAEPAHVYDQDEVETY